MLMRFLLVDGKSLTTVLPSGNVHREHRKLMETVLNPQVVKTNYMRLQEDEAHKLLNDLLNRPSDFWEDIHLLVGSDCTLFLY
jgi:cytochrome P450